MPNHVAVLLGAIIIALAIFFRPADRYQIASSVDAIGNPLVWRIDLRTGEVDTCAIKRSARAAVPDEDNPFLKITGPPIVGPPAGECTSRR